MFIYVPSWEIHTSLHLSESLSSNLFISFTENFIVQDIITITILCITSSEFSFLLKIIDLFIYIFEIQSWTDTARELYFTGLRPTWLQWEVLVQVKVRCQKVHLRLPSGWQRPKELTHLPLLFPGQY